LPQGGVSSPALANAVFFAIDEKLISICESQRIAYTRYADDLTFSTNYKDRLIKLIAKANEIIEENGFHTNSDKTRLMSGQGPLRVTGLNLNNEQVSIGRDKKRQLRAELHSYFVKGDHTRENEIFGMLSYLRFIEPESYQKMKSYCKKMNANINKSTR